MRESDLSVVVSTLEEEFSIFEEVGGESIPVHSQDVSNGIQKNGREGTPRFPVSMLSLFFFFEKMVQTISNN